MRATNFFFFLRAGELVLFKTNINNSINCNYFNTKIMNYYDIKARELVAKMQMQKEPLMFDAAKLCAQIYVYEILKNIDATILYHNDSKTLLINKDYWIQVRTALNAL